jgi:FlgD Ig-like domain
MLLKEIKLLLIKNTGNRQKNVFYYTTLLVILSIFVALFIFPNIAFGQIVNNQANSYTFTLQQNAKTSAGVYTTDSVLVRTLWNLQAYKAGTYNIQWDGKDDLGNQVTPGNYIVKVISNNVVYTWMGIVGNTSTNKTGSTVHRGEYLFMTGMTIANGTAYYCSGYSERRPSSYKFNTATPQQKLDVEPIFNTTTTLNDFVVNDGKMTYWAGDDPYATSKTLVYAKNISDDSDVKFQFGAPFKGFITRQYNSVISYMNLANSYITGLAVQKKGNFLFIARAGLNALYVLDKTTGQLLQTIAVNKPMSLCVDMNDNLWMVSNGTSANKYNVKLNGTLSAPILTISTVILPTALAVSPDNSTITIADGGMASQQIKGFDNLTGTQLWTLGQPGGYMQDATVTNNKFYLSDVKGQLVTGQEPGYMAFIAYQPDGSFWVNDPGNWRVQHFSPQRNFIETIMALGMHYSTWADKNDNTKVGAEYLEFKIDNTDTISGSTGWKLVKNWGANITAFYDKTTKFSNVITLTSGGVSRTFGFLRNQMNYYLVEFQANNTLRFTGVIKPHCNIEKDGALVTDDFGSAQPVLKKYTFIGFDNLNNPIWNAVPQVLVDMSKVQNRVPYPTQEFRSSFITSTNKIIFYDYAISNASFHLGAIQIGGNTYSWKTQMATETSYIGPFPDVSHYDIGNGGNYSAGSAAMVSNRNVITGYHGEFWKASQTNMYNHYLDNGLAIGQFGAVGPWAVPSPAMMAGNALTPQLVNGMSADELYLWHGDESFHGGMHKWRISGLSTIKEQDIPITYPFAALTPTINPGNDLMVNLPYDSPLLNNTAGWTINPATAQAGWQIKTNALVPVSTRSSDIYVTCTSATGTFSVSRDLGQNSGLTSWNLTGQISYYNTDQQGAMAQYFDVLDKNGKIIARISNKWVFAGYTNSIYGNNKLLVTGLDKTFITPMIMNQLQPVQISANANLITILYAGYSVTAPIFDPTADISSPQTMRAYITGGYNPTRRCFDFKDMRFITNKANQTITFNPGPTNAVTSPTFTLMATTSSNLPVTFSVVSGPAIILGNTITLTGTGNVVVTALQAGDAFNNPAAPVTQTFTNANVRTDL